MKNTVSPQLSDTGLKLNLNTYSNEKSTQTIPMIGIFDNYEQLDYNEYSSDFTDVIQPEWVKFYNVNPNQTGANIVKDFNVPLKNILKISGMMGEKLFKETAAKVKEKAKIVWEIAKDIGQVIKEDFIEKKIMLQETKSRVVDGIVNGIVYLLDIIDELKQPNSETAQPETTTIAEVEQESETTAKPPLQPETTTIAEVEQESETTTKPPLPPETTTQTVATKPNQNAELTQKLIDTVDTLVVGKGVDTTVRTDCQAYEVTSSKNDNNRLSSGQLSQKERELLIYIAYHEAGIPGDPTQATAVMSTFLNGWEVSNMSFGQYVYQSCAKWSEGDQFYNERFKYKDGSYTYDDVISYKKYREMVNNGYYDTLSACMDNVLAGVRNVNSTQWAGYYTNKYGRNVDMYHAPLKK